jgi:hypothetical protein
MERTYLRCYLYDCPEAERDAAATAMDYENMSATGEEWVNGDAPVDSAGTLAEALRDAAPGASWVLWEDAGMLYARTPELGDFSASCTAGGDVVLTHHEMTEVIGKAAAEPEASSALAMAAVIARAVDWAAGVPWMEDWAAHRQ